MQFIFLVAGLSAILLAFSAEWLGIDNNPVWGTGRYLLLIFGVALSGFAVLLHYWKTGYFPVEIKQRITDIGNTFRRAFSRCLHWLACWQAFSYILAIILVLLIAVYAIWYTSAGRFPVFTPVSNTYVDLGEAFLHGQLSLLQKPDPRLATLANPYDTKQQGLIPFLWDSSYYKGKYYLYWGPVPAVIFSVAEWILQARPADQLVVLISYIGLAAILLVILFHIRKRFFPNAPGISIPFFVLAAGINLPYLFILGKPQIYETSIITGQFFLISGLLAWLRYQIAERYYWLGLSGLCWGLAIASRYNLVISVGVFVVFGLYSLYQKMDVNRHSKPGTNNLSFVNKCIDWKAILALLAPLLLCGFALGYYNYTRFGNPLETGFTYQHSLSERVIYSISYVPSNFFMYLAYPVKVSGGFPFYKSDSILYNLLPGWAARPTGKMFDTTLVGILPALPVFWPLALVIPLTGKLLIRQFQDKPLKEGLNFVKPPLLLLTMLLFAGLLQFAFLLIYYYGAMRFIVDFYIPLLLATYIIIWTLDKQLQNIPIIRWLFWLGVIVLTIWTVWIGFFAGFDIPPQYFRAENPHIFGELFKFWNHQYNQVIAVLGKPQIFEGTIARTIVRVVEKFSR